MITRTATPKYGLLLLFFCPACSWRCLAQDEPAKSSAGRPVKVLLVTGIEYHNWRETAPQIAKQLARAPASTSTGDRFQRPLSDKIFDYDVLFFNFWNSGTTTRPG